VHVIDPGPRKETREDAEAKQAAADAIIDLTALFASASARGVNAAASFAHFDTGGFGVVTPAGLQAGMADLGMKLSERAAGMVFSQMSSDERYASMHPLCVFNSVEY
jgi:hypothetical protein